MHEMGLGLCVCVCLFVCDVWVGVNDFYIYACMDGHACISKAWICDSVDAVVEFVDIGVWCGFWEMVSISVVY